VSDIPASRFDRRKARTRASLIRAAQELLAGGRQNAPILEITQLADIGIGSFYNHFATREELFEAAIEEALDTHGAVLDELTLELEDPADVFATSFRITGRLHRIVPQLSTVVLASGLSVLHWQKGLVPRLRRDLAAAHEAGRFEIEDLDLAVAMIGGAALTLAQLIHDQPERDDAEATDLVTIKLLQMLGLTPAQARKLGTHPLPEFRPALSDSVTI
jgi:AcrR family transcriptional regulator